VTLPARASWITNLPGSIVTESAPSGTPPNQRVRVTITDPVNASTPTNRLFQLKVQP
jgi:hypothetical protein